MSAIDELRQWGENARERIAVMAEDWQDILRLQYAEKLVELRQFPPKAAVPAHDADGVVWEESCERPATAEDAAARLAEMLADRAARRAIDRTERDSVPGFLDRRQSDDQAAQYLALVGAS
jgi:hypothetical protein